MTYTVRIMPLQPIEAEPSAVKGRYAVVTYESEDGKARHTSTLPDVGWVEVSDPIVWDGTDETADAITEMFLTASTGWQASLNVETAECVIGCNPSWGDPRVWLTFDRLDIGDSITVNGRWPHVIRAEEVEP